jgi:hypothetical protein
MDIQDQVDRGRNGENCGFDARRRTARAAFGGGAANPIAFVFIKGHVRHLAGNWLHNCGSVRILKFEPSAAAISPRGSGAGRLRAHALFLLTFLSISTF